MRGRHRPDRNLGCLPGYTAAILPPEVKEHGSPQVGPSTRQQDQQDLVERAHRIAGVAEAMQVHDAVSSYLSTAPARVAWMQYATGGNPS